MKEEELLVRKIKNGTVIDHIPAGKSLKVVDILKFDSSSNETVVILINASSKKLGKKDIVKIENRELTKDETNKIALIAPNATINIIRDWEVVEKRKVILPEILEGIVKCPNSNCITNSNEPIITKFLIQRREPLKLKCWYCERSFRVEEIL
ncbi:MAG: aspartate carbamoyltransferase regulatory subunit [Candidatus Aenigmatarchaeota archaeon]